MIEVAALFVESPGIYTDVPGIDPWPEARDARLYAGPYPVIAHPPCERWGRYWHGGPSVKVRRVLGDDAGCFASALASVRAFGGVLEHPEASHAFRVFGLGFPRPGSWQRIAPREWITRVSQIAYGHRARKRTWLLYVGAQAPFDLDWSEPQGIRFEYGFHTKAERDAARAAGRLTRSRADGTRLTSRENAATPPDFAAVLLALALHSRA